MNNTKPLNPIIPYDLNMGPYGEMLEAVRRMNREYGIKRLLVTGPNLGVGSRASLAAMCIVKSPKA